MDCTIYVAKTKALISFAVTAKLICVFVFAYAKRWYSHNAAHVVCFRYLQERMKQMEEERTMALAAVSKYKVFESCCKKTCLRGVRLGPTQTGLYSHRRLQEA